MMSYVLNVLMPEVILVVYFGCRGNRCVNTISIANLLSIILFVCFLNFILTIVHLFMSLNTFVLFHLTDTKTKKHMFILAESVP